MDIYLGGKDTERESSMTVTSWMILVTTGNYSKERLAYQGGKVASTSKFVASRHEALG